MDEKREKTAIQNIFDAVNISKLKPCEKFVEFTPYIDKIEDVKFKHRFTEFTTDDLYSEKMPSSDERLLSLLNLRDNLEKHIQKEMKLELEQEIAKLMKRLRKKYEKKYGMIKLLKKIESMQET